MSAQNNSAWFALLGFVIATELVATQLFPETDVRPVWYKAVHLFEMAALLLLFRSTGKTSSAVQKLIAAGLLLSLVGDIINSYLFDLSSLLKPQTLLSIPLFASAHILYSIAFYRSGGKHSPNGIKLISLIAWTPIAVMLWLIIIDSDSGNILKYASLGYALIITIMLIQVIWLKIALGGLSLLLCAAISFMLSDMLLGSYLTAGDQRPLWVSQAIWLTYFLGQWGIAKTSRQF